MNGPTDGANYLFQRHAQYQGGQPGWVNSAVKTYTLVGPDCATFEWGNFSLLENWSKSGENVAQYAQAKAMAKGVTWAGCFEVRDDGGKAEGLWGIEVDTMANGTDNWRTRYGVVSVIGKAIPSEVAPLGYAGFVSGAIAQTATSGQWSAGYTCEIARDACYASESSCTADVFLAPKGKHIVGLDCSQGEIQQPIRIKAGQRITLEETGQIAIRFNPITFAVEFLNGDLVMHSFKMS